MPNDIVDLEKRLLAMAVFELRVILSSFQSDQGAAGMASQLAYALHNQALATIEGRPFDVVQALDSLDRLESLLGAEYLRHFRKVVLNEA